MKLGKKIVVALILSMLLLSFGGCSGNDIDSILDDNSLSPASDQSELTVESETNDSETVTSLEALFEMCTSIVNNVDNTTLERDSIGFGDVVGGLVLSMPDGGELGTAGSIYDEEYVKPILVLDYDEPVACDLTYDGMAYKMNVVKILIESNGFLYIMDENPDKYICVGQLIFEHYNAVPSSSTIEGILERADSVTIHSSGETYQKDTPEFDDVFAKSVISLDGGNVVESAYDPENVKIVVTFNYVDGFATELISSKADETIDLDIVKIELCEDGIFYILCADGEVLPVGVTDIEGLF